ncbi:6,7,8-trihydroxycoumarin synthase-like [Apium graveolens]|uniref:6,7,8-trihydroxycoumarin synthase-like n=1 Tax=Apium graveolens TaxID=4045 RepID=UPI003D795825
MEVIFLLIAITLPLFLLFILKNYISSKSNQPIPGPRGLPLIGNMHQFDSENTHIYLHHLSKKYGPLTSLQLGSAQILVISSAGVAKEVFKYHDLCFSSRPSRVAIQKLSYNNLGLIFAPYNEYWRNMRKFATLHLLSTKSLRSFQPIREEEIARMIKTIHDGAAADSSIENLSKTLMTLTGTIIYRITFGAENDDDISSKFHWLLSESQAHTLSFFFQDYFPLIGRFVDRLTGAWARLEKGCNELDAFYQKLIDEHLASSDSSTKDSSILGMLLEMKRDSSDFTLDHVKANIMNVIVAAADTSAASVVWAMTLLIQNPESMKKVQREVRDIVQKKGFVNDDDVQKLVYLKAVVKETMRLYPPAPILLRETTEKCVISGYEIEAKTCVFVNSYAIGRDPECWENPDKFLPERFVNSSIDFKGHDFELIPFGAGRRMCPGLSVGAATAEQMLANLLYSFNWELPPGKSSKDLDMDTLPGITVHKKNHLCLVPKNVD